VEVKMMQEESIILEFPKGIPGFEEYDQFTMKLDEETPLAQMTVIDDDEMGFLLLQPQAMFDGYMPQIELDDEAASLLDLDEGENVDMWVIVTLGDNIRESTANLRAPLLINMRTQKGVQMIIDNDTYKSSQPLFIH
jgi:flagellar assembly factor FliW